VFNVIKGYAIDIFTIILLVFIMIAAILGYSYYLQDKNKELEKIEQGFCPKCKQKTIELVDIRGSGCSPKVMTFECSSCGYENSFTRPSNCSL